MADRFRQYGGGVPQRSEMFDRLNRLKPATPMHAEQQKSGCDLRKATIYVTLFVIFIGGGLVLFEPVEESVGSQPIKNQVLTCEITRNSYFFTHISLCCCF